VAACTSDVILEKAETERKKAQSTTEIEAQEKAVRDLEDQLKNNNQKIIQIETTIKQKNQELYNHVKATSKKSNDGGFLSALVPFVGAIANLFKNADDDSEAAAKAHVLSSELTQLSIEKSSLMGKEWSIQVRMMDMQLKLATMKIENGKILDFRSFSSRARNSP